jgi:hypothetical protein
MISRVYSVMQVSVGTTLISDNSVPALTISAIGQVNSGGWSNPELGPWSYITPPADGILDLDFLATPPKPGVIVSMGFQNITAHAILAIPDWVRGVRVHASTNSMEQRIDASSSAKSGGHPVPWPWFQQASAATSAGVLPLFDVKLTFPEIIYVSWMPPVPDRLTVRATASITVKNNSGKSELLIAPTPAAIHHWEVFDEAGRMVDSEKDELTITVLQSRNFEPGETLRSDYLVSLNGKVLSENARYRLRFKFWSFEGEAFFRAKIVQ